ncbi:MAG TPA: PIN domain-containing protein [Spirochaetota bacterium]|nr:PIN domain-containing protein [Spirochaetota bacterium]HOS33273.1 PIN domain-containing protein [Spirochaetota bacterium]HOS56577.1 PIN domain-containing protein [Spirochaetota bacterium]HPK62681.1 PIN domain-containing protein [Spirochaetota bacterium]HQF78845.1 PIN domain-containing protein [Spirochaetota bacterium]
MINKIFIDTFAWIALINKSDNYHKLSVDLFNEILIKNNKLYTSTFIITETINALSKFMYRKPILEFLNRIQNSQILNLIEINMDIYNNSINLFKKRIDKEWGLTDCSSFIVMEKYDIIKAFTNDKHFEQAGFELLI